MRLMESFNVPILLALLVIYGKTILAQYDYEEVVEENNPKCWKLIKSDTSPVAGEGNINIVDFLGNGSSEFFPVRDGLPKDVVLILGNTGAGKTTLTQMIAGDLSKLHAVETEGGGLAIVDDDERIGQPGTTSRTIIPELLLTQSESFFDCPGFDDNRRAEYDLAVNYFMNQITARVNRVKLVFLINQNSVQIGKDRNELDRLITHATKFVKNLGEFQSSIGLVVTKVEKYSTHKKRALTNGEIKQSIVDFLSTYKGDLQKAMSTDIIERGISQKKEQFVNILLNNDAGFYSHIAFSSSPDFCGRLNESDVVADTRTRVLTMIRNLNFSDVGNSTANFGFTLKEKTLREVREVFINDINQAVTMEISELLSKFRTWYNTVYTKSMESPIVGNELLKIWQNTDNLEIIDSSLINIAQELCVGLAATGYNCSHHFPEFMAEKQQYFEFFDRVTESKMERRTIQWLQIVNEVKQKIKADRELFKLEVVSERVKEVNDMITKRVQLEATRIMNWIYNRLRNATSDEGLISKRTWKMLSNGYNVSTTIFSNRPSLFAAKVVELTRILGSNKLSDDFMVNMSLANDTFDFYEEFLQKPVSRDVDTWVKPLLAVEQLINTERAKYLKNIRSVYAKDAHARIKKTFDHIKDDFTAWFEREKTDEEKNYPRVSLKMKDRWKLPATTPHPSATSPIDIYGTYHNMLEKLGCRLSQIDEQNIIKETRLLNVFDSISREKLSRPIQEWTDPLRNIQSQVSDSKANYLNLLDGKFVADANDGITLCLKKALRNFGSWLENSVMKNSYGIDNLKSFLGKVGNVENALMKTSRQFSARFDNDIKEVLTRFGFTPPADYGLIAKHIDDLRFFDELKGKPVKRNTETWKNSVLDTKDRLDDLRLRTERQIVDLQASLNTEQVQVSPMASRKSIDHTVYLNGQYSWELIMDINNTKNAGIVRRTLETSTAVHGNYYELQKRITDSIYSSSSSGDINIPLKVLQVSASKTSHHGLTYNYQRILEQKHDVRHETRMSDTYEVGPFSQLKLYQLVFNGPGVYFKTDTISSTPHPTSNVQIEVMCRIQLMLEDLKVIYSKDAASRPIDTLGVVGGGNPDINAGFGGYFVYLVPSWTRDPSKGVTTIQFVRQKNYNNAYWDLAAGAGGDFRYLKIIKDPSSRSRITEIVLWRNYAKQPWYDPGSKGWTHRTADLNEHRKGDYLYVCWRGIDL